MEKTARIFVAGHRGLVGSSILKELQSQGYTNLIIRTHQELDLCDAAKVDEFFKEQKIDYVFLCAAKVGGILANNTYRADFIYTNLAIQNSVIFHACKYGVKKLLFLGSSCIYPKNTPQPIKEDALLSSELEYTNEPYAIAKIAGMKMCESFNLQYGTNFLCVMPTNLYGENDSFDLNSAHVLPALIHKIYLAKLLEEQNFQAIAHNLNIPVERAQEVLESHGIRPASLTIWGSGKARREFLHAADMAKACTFIMQNVNFQDLIQNKKEIRNTHINIGYGEDISIKELAALMCDVIGYRGEICFDHEKPDGTMKKLMDISKISSLGWKPQIHLREGISQVYQYYVKKQNF